MENAISPMIDPQLFSRNSKTVKFEQWPKCSMRKWPIWAMTSRKEKAHEHPCVVWSWRAAEARRLLCVCKALSLAPPPQHTQEGKSRWTAVNVKRLLSPRQSRGITHFIYAYGGFG